MSETIKITVDDLLFATIPSTARARVIEISVNIERNVGIMLALLLNIKIEESKSFGMSSSALSFNHKINLLTDLEIINSDQKAVLNKFSEIRNIFAHNGKITHFFECFKHNQLRNFLENRYGQQKSEFEEDTCGLLFNKLYEDVQKVCRSLFQTMLNNAHDKGKSHATISYHNNLLTGIEELCQVDIEFKEKIKKIHEAAVKEISDLEQ